MSVLDTPARAARASRPQTRGWRHMISEAASETEKAGEIRTQLRAHLAAADQLAARRAAAAAAAEKEKEKPLALDVLQTLDTDWNERVAVLERLRASPAEHDMAPVVPHLCVQLSDLRSKVVSAASQAIAAIAAAKLLDAEQAAELFEAGAKGANVSKKVMADARKAAARAALHAQTDVGLFVRVARVAVDSPYVAARVLSAQAIIEAVDIAADADCVAEPVGVALGAAAVDRAGEVRAAARELKAAFEKRFGSVAWAQVEKDLSQDAKARLSGAGGGAAPVKATARRGAGTVGKGGKGRPVGKGPKGRPSMKEMIKAKREALKKQREADAAKAANEEKQEPAERKRSSPDVGLSARKDRSKKGVFVQAGKENLPAPSE